MIEFKNVSKKYGDIAALDNVNFLIEKGSFVFLVGPTGSGKTTIFRLIIRDLQPSEGQIILDNVDIHKLKDKHIPQLRRKVGVIFQDLKLLMDRTVLENVMLPLQFSGVKEKDAKIRTEEIIAEVGLSGRMNQFPLQLSGGERQRVAIARALIFKPEILLADEPTGNLDSETTHQILDLLNSINKKGTTVFMATHNDHLVHQMGNRVIAMKNGSIAEDRSSKHPKPEHKQEEPPVQHTEQKVEDKSEEKKEEKNHV